MTEFYQRLIYFLQKELPAVEEAINQEQSLPELIRLQRIRAMMKELLDHALFYSKGKGTT
ncbi:MAG: hypothetical protein HXS48_16805 [Theionarchaea archaeon]|nr:hypothetical protein [Theionarchaea archaeon]